MQIGSIVREIRRPDRLYLITEERSRSWVITPLGFSGDELVLVKKAKGFEVIA